MQNYFLKFIIFLWLTLFISGCSTDKKYDKKKAIDLLTNNQETIISGEKVLLSKTINKKSFTYNQLNGFEHLAKKVLFSIKFI